jgi:hypothetical protein
MRAPAPFFFTFEAGASCDTGQHRAGAAENDRGIFFLNLAQLSV